jgi:2-keto-4-pentenoate hydratase/2-oxohepta-3-ene-1,7-dioic acid hydratase in catechol pathway
MMEFIDGAGSLTGAMWRRALETMKRAGTARRRSRPAYVHPAGRVKLHAPIRPRMLRDFIAFRGHIARTRTARGEKVPPEWDLVPAYYNGNPWHVVGPEAAVPVPQNVSRLGDVWSASPTQKLDYEAEIGYVVGRDGWNVAPEKASVHLFGLTIFNDFSMRDLQTAVSKIGMGPAAGKDWANALGPCIVTRDEFGPLREQRIEVRVNGTVRLSGTFDDLVFRNAWVQPSERAMWTFEDLVGFLSRTQRIQAGEIWGSGTIPGGCELEKGEAAKYLEPGDQVEIRIEGIGTLSNRIVAEALSTK